MKLEIRSHHQGVLESALGTIFPTRNLKKNVRKKVSIKNPLTGGYLEVDVWYEDLKLGFEYQDEHHYQPSWYSQIPLNVLKEKDDIKRIILLQKGQTLIQVPCWWDGTPESLRVTIKFYRPDLLPSQHIHSGIIPVNPVQDFFSDVSSSGDKQLMLASFPTSPEMEEMAEHNPWWLGEKYDGVRCFWSPQDEQLYSRNKKIIDVHPAVSKMFGPVALDGEIWCGRGQFLESLVVFNASLDKVDWGLVRIICFDEASRHMRQPFEARYWLILSHYPPDHSVVIIAPRFSCSSVTALMNSLQQVIDEGGEGIILRRPHSLYQPGRSSDLVKFKGSRSDQEALVVGVLEDRFLELQLPNGTIFAVVTANCELPRRAVRGDVVTFSHDFSRRIGTHDGTFAAQDNSQTPWKQQVTRATARRVPTNIVVHRIRTDVTWEDVLSSAGLPVRQFHNEPYQKINDTAKPNPPHKFWEATQNRRELLVKFASSKGCDPLLPHFWYNLNLAELSSVKGTRAITDNYAETVVHLFPELHLDITKFKQPTVQSWKTEVDRRAFFDKFAASKGGDSRNPLFWSRVAVRVLCHDQPGYKTIVGYHGGRLSTCLMQLYPDIGLKQSHFGTRTSLLESKWSLKETRKSALLQFAKVHSFDPLVPANWYQLSWVDYSGYFLTSSMLRHCYNRKYVTALMDLLPELNLKPSNFVTAAQSWKTEADRRVFFDKYAASKGMDPRNPDFWSRVTVHDLRRYRLGFTTIARYHGGRLSTCLMQLYPDIGLKQSQFGDEHQKGLGGYLESVAKKHSFDPLQLSAWASFLSSQKISRFVYRTIRYITTRHSTTAEALVTLFPETRKQKVPQALLSKLPKWKAFKKNPCLLI